MHRDVWHWKFKIAVQNHGISWPSNFTEHVCPNFKNWAKHWPKMAVQNCELSWPSNFAEINGQNCQYEGPSFSSPSIVKCHDHQTLQKLMVKIVNITVHIFLYPQYQYDILGKYFLCTFSSRIRKPKIWSYGVSGWLFMKKCNAVLKRRHHNNIKWVYYSGYAKQSGQSCQVNGILFIFFSLSLHFPVSV